MLKKMIRSKLVLLGMTVATAPGLTGCTDAEVSATLGAVAIGAAVAAVATSPGYQCVGGYREVCSTHRTYRGHRSRSCSNVYESCMYRRAYSADAAPASASNEAIYLQDYAVGAAFKMDHESAGRFIGALKQARDEKKLDAILDLGLSKGDLKKMSKGKLPSDEGLNALAEKLDQDLDDTREMMQQLIDQAAQLKAAKAAS